MIQAPDKTRTRWPRDALVAIGLAAITFLLFIPARHFDFLNLDDPQYVAGNDRVLQGLSWENVRWAFTTLKAANWQPLTWLSHMLDVSLYGQNPAGHHLSSVILHALNAALLYLVLVSRTNPPWRRGIVAAILPSPPLRQ